jgi:hypothetical protein
MNRFSDYTDIDFTLQVVVDLKVHGETTYKFLINGKDQGLAVELPLGEPITFSLSVEGEAVEIVNISINGNQIMPIYLHYSTPETCWVTDRWTMDINNFYRWWHDRKGHGMIF